jgi:hypothetical protein
MAGTIAPQDPVMTIMKIGRQGVVLEVAFGAVVVRTDEASGITATPSETKIETAVLHTERDEVGLGAHPVDTEVGET